MSIVSSAYEPLETPFCLTGDFAGEENEGTGSNPCSSRIPVSFNVAPVLLLHISAMNNGQVDKHSIIWRVFAMRLTALFHQQLRSLALSERAWGFWTLLAWWSKCPNKGNVRAIVDFEKTTIRSLVICRIGEKVC